MALLCAGRLTIAPCTSRQLVSGSLRRSARVPVACSPQPKGRKGRAALLVQANELNPWANTDGRDEDAGDSGFDTETASVVLRLLTARATQRVLGQVQEFDLFVGQWLNNWCSENPPSEGNKFLIKLFAQHGKAITDPSTGQVHTIDPQKLAHRILQTRDAMAAGIASSGFASYVSLESTTVLRSHLENNSYTSGATERGYKDRRGYYRRPQGRPKY